MRKLKFILSPSNEQKKLIDMNIEACIMAYNWAINTNYIERKNTGKILQRNQIAYKVARLKFLPEYWTFNNCSSQALNNSIHELYLKYDDYFKSRDANRLPKPRELDAEEEHMGYPSGKVMLHLAEMTIYLPKIGWVNLGESYQDISDEIQRKYHVGYTKITRKNDVYTAEITVSSYYSILEDCDLM